eukprot:gene5821-7245_t
MKNPVYLYIKFTNGIAYNEVFDNSNIPPSVLIGVRVAIASGMFGVGSQVYEHILQFYASGSIKRFTFEYVMNEIKKNCMANGKMLPLAIIIHLDEFQAYITSFKDNTIGLSKFKSMLDQIGTYMQNTKDSFIIPICTGTTDRGLHHLKTGYNNVSLNLLPLNRKNCDSIIEYHFTKKGYDSKPFIGTNSFEIGLRDTGFIPKDITYFLSFWLLHKKIWLRFAFLGTPITLETKLPSGQTIDDLRLEGFLYLVPTSNSMNPLTFYLYISFYNLKSFNQSMVTPLFPDKLLFIPSRHERWVWQDFELLYPFFQMCLIKCIPDGLTVHQIFRGTYGIEYLKNESIEIAPKLVGYEDNTSITLSKIQYKMNLESKSSINDDLLECNILGVCSQNTESIDHRFSFKQKDGTLVIVYVQSKHSKQDVKNPNHSNSKILENANIALGSMAKLVPNSTKNWIGIFFFVTNRIVNQDVIKDFEQKKKAPHGVSNLLRENHYLLVVSHNNFEKFFGQTLSTRGLNLQLNEDESFKNESEEQDFYSSQKQN